MNDEMNNVTNENVENVEAPKKKAKWLLGFGIFAVVAVVAGTLVFANGGEWFKGSAFDFNLPDLPGTTIPKVDFTENESSTPSQDYVNPGILTSVDIYVDDDPTLANDANCLSDSNCDYDDDVAEGTKAAPYRTISAAITKAASDKTTIHVAKGTYDEDNRIFNSNISFIGSYNSSFSSTNLNTTPSIHKGVIGINDSQGSIENFQFTGEANSSKTVVIAIMKTNNSKVYTIKNNKFTNLNITRNAISIDSISGSGTNAIIISNNEFINIDSTDGAIIDGSSAAPVIIDGNFISKSYSKNRGIIKVGANDIVKNNIIVNSDALAKVIIEANGSEIYNNTFAYNNNQPSGNFGMIDPIKKVAIKSTGSDKIWNNLVVENNTYRQDDRYNASNYGGTIAAFDIATSTAHLKNNAIHPITLKTDVKGVDSGVLLTCDPGFSIGDSADDYKLESDSTCINNGTDISSVNKDYFGTSRPVGAKYDLGAHEHTTASNLVLFTPFLELERMPLNNDPDGTIEICDDGVDNNSNGLVDCDDPLCTVACSTVLEDEICDDGIDNDNNSHTDCDDWACDDHASCIDEGNNNDGDDGNDGTSDDDDEDDNNDGNEGTSDPDTCTCDWPDLTNDANNLDETAAKWLCERGCIVTGHQDGTIRLNEQLNRAELLAIAFRASKYKRIYNVNYGADYCFNDVTSESNGHWFAPYICTAKDKGFVEGYAGNLAKPGNTVILGEALKMILGALDEDYEINENGTWYIDMVLDAAEDGHSPYTVDNASDAKIVGAVKLTRGKAFNMLYRILKY